MSQESSSSPAVVNNDHNQSVDVKDNQQQQSSSNGDDNSQSNAPQYASNDDNNVGAAIGTVNGASLASSVLGASSFDRRQAEQATAVKGEDGVLFIPTKLFVGSLPPSCTDDVLFASFSVYGPVSEARIQRDKFTGESRKFGFVVYHSAAGADAAVKANQEKEIEIEGKRINLKRSEAQGQGIGSRFTSSRQQTGNTYSGSNSSYGGGSGHNDGPGSYPRGGIDGRDRDGERSNRGSGRAIFGEPGLKIFVGRLDPNSSDEDLRAHFTQFGPLSECTIMKERVTAKSRGFAFIHYENLKGLEACFAHAEHKIGDSVVSLERSKPRLGGGPGLSNQHSHADDRRDDRHGGGGYGRDDRRDYRGGDRDGGDRYRQGGGGGYGGYEGYPPHDAMAYYHAAQYAAVAQQNQFAAAAAYPGFGQPQMMQQPSSSSSRDYRSSSSSSQSSSRRDDPYAQQQAPPQQQYQPAPYQQQPPAQQQNYQQAPPQQPYQQQQQYAQAAPQQQYAQQQSYAPQQGGGGYAQQQQQPQSYAPQQQYAQQSYGQQQR